ncbi:signal peptidase II [Patescibacteria group bacterium]|nr:signal peptidase II [Patescibacteria group bacterium]
MVEPMLNRGISFSRGVPYMIVIPLTVIACVAFIRLLMQKYISGMVFVLLMAGTLGNGIDRVLFDGVRDFIVFPHLFICNIADIFLSIAVMVILWREYRQWRKR